MPVCKMCGYTASSAQTICRICGKPLEPTPLTEETQPAAQAVPRARINGLFVRRAGLIAAPTIIAAGTLGFFLFQKSIPTFDQIVPRTAVGVAEVDGPWWWNASTDVRAQPEIKKAIESAEDEAGISVGQDIAPWVGEIGISVLNADTKKPQILACAQVRDWPAFFRTVARLKSRASDETGGTWTEINYNGVQIQRLVPKVATDPVVEICWINGWVLAGFGEGAVEKSIDTFQGHADSLRSDATWMTALGHRPKNWFLWAGADWARLVPTMKTAMTELMPYMADGMADPKAFASIDSSMKTMKDMDGVTVVVASDSGNGLRLDSINVPRTEKTRTTLRDLHGTSGPINGDILKQLPSGSMMAFLGHDPNGWWRRYDTAVVSQMTPEARKSIEPFLKEIRPLEPTVSNFKGDCGMALTFDEKQGFGGVALAQATSAAAASQSARAVAAYLQNNQIKVKGSVGDFNVVAATSSESVSPAAPSLLTHDATNMFSYSVCFGARDNYLVAASKPALLTANSGTGSTLAFPDEARNADSAAFGDFRQLPNIMKAAGAATAIPTVNKLGLANAHWDMYVVSAPDGSLQQGTCEIQGWNWRAAIKNFLNLIP